MGKTTQRIKLRIQGTPVKLDGTILEMSKDGSRLNVRFDGPMDDITLYRWSPTLLIDTDLNGKHRLRTGLRLDKSWVHFRWMIGSKDGHPNWHREAQFWEVL